MKKITVVILMCWAVNLYSQSSTIIPKGSNGMFWQLVNVIQTTDGGKLIVGGYDSLSLIKVNNNNQVLWVKALFEGIGNLKVELVEKNSNYYFCFQSVNLPDGKTYIMKFDNLGQLIYSKYLLYPNIGSNWITHDGKSNVIINNSDEVLITGSYEGMMTLHKLDNIGNLIFGYKISPDTINSANIRGYSSALCNDGGVIFTCKADTTGIIVKVNSGGIFQWAKSYDVSILNDCRPRKIIKTVKGDYIISGYSVDYVNIIGQIPFLMKIDSIGNLKWYNEYTAGQYSDYALAEIAEQSNNDFIGYFGTNGVLYETDSVGIVTAKKAYNIDCKSIYTYTNQAYINSYDRSTIITNGISQNNCLITDTLSFNIIKTITSNSVVAQTSVKIESYGLLYNSSISTNNTNVQVEQTCATVGIKEESDIIQISFYPNPTASIVNIIDENNQLQNSTIHVQNYLGQVVFSSGFTSQINISTLQPGIYFLTIKDKNREKTVKIIKL